ncbi:MAG: hypothetical protein JWP97_4030 [Labilithrix sp.]|nr:hypothetical protein [Labilithrix sp.]
MASARRRVYALGALWLAVTGGASAITACYAHNCDGDADTYGDAPGEGHMIDENTWESSPPDGDAIPFTKQRVWYFQIPEFGDRIPYEVTPYISAEQNPIRENGNFTIGSGNLAEQSGLGAGRITIKNNTCADYYIRVVAHAPPRPPVAPVNGDAGAQDAAVPPAQPADAAADSSD